ncbi:MAG TPA: hypothetical protein VN521_03535 [Negativicutes bacterium]|nr:hypothetical protein [Negativicutes bacterium]
MDSKEKLQKSARELFSVQGSDFMEVDAAKEVVAELLSKAGAAKQDGEQQYYVLEGEEAQKVLDKLAVRQAPQGFIQTSEWVQPAAQSGHTTDEALQALGNRLQTAGKPPEPAPADTVDCQCGDDVYVLPDEQAMQEFVANLGVCDASNYTKTTAWDKNQGDADNRQLALLTDIAARLQAIETVLLRLEQTLKNC